MERRRVEVFTAGCPVCEDAVALVKRLACDSCEVSVLPMSDPALASRARGIAIRSVPAVAIDGHLVDCCAHGPEEAALRAAGLGRPLD